MCSNYGMPQVARTVSKWSQAVLMAADPEWPDARIRTGRSALARAARANSAPPARLARPVTTASAPASRWPADRRARSRLARVIPASLGQIASGLPVTLGPGSPADGPEHGPPLRCHGQPAASAFREPRPAQPLPSSR
jgi:hypothetical protein